MCPDEEGTETIAELVNDDGFVIVEACAPMKRGLKLFREITVVALNPPVEACAPMKRGLKHLTPELIRQSTES